MSELGDNVGNGERGPQGDHGQHGDRGDTGITGATGARGREGQEGVAGERGPTGDTGLTGSVGPVGRAGKDWRLDRWSTLRLLAFALVATATIYSSARTFEIADQARESARIANVALALSESQRIEGRDQICMGDEREHVNTVLRLTRTYEYLETLPEAERDSSITRAILRQLPETEAEARTDTAPEFCDEPGFYQEQLYKTTDGKKGSPPIGLPEPDMAVPKRPQVVHEMIRAERERLAGE